MIECERCWLTHSIDIDAVRAARCGILLIDGLRAPFAVTVALDKEVSCRILEPIPLFLLGVGATYYEELYFLILKVYSNWTGVKFWI